MGDYFINQQCGVIVDEYFWGFNADENELFRTNIDTGVIEYVTSFEKIQIKDCLFNNIIEYKGKLLLLPGNSDYIVTYQIETGEKMYYEYRDSFSKYVPYQSFYKFAVVETYNNFIYMFSCIGGYILIINIDTMEMEYYEEPFVGKDIRIKNSIYRKDENIYLFCENKDFILKMDLCSKKYEWIKVKDKKFLHKVKYITNENEQIYALSNDNKVYQWSKKEKKFRVIYKSDNEFSTIHICEKGILLIPAHRSNFISINTDLKIREYGYCDDFSFSPFLAEDTITHTKIAKKENACVVVPRCSNMLIVFDNQGQELKFIKIKVDENCKKYFYKKYRDENNLYTIENGLQNTLPIFLKCITEK